LADVCRIIGLYLLLLLIRSLGRELNATPKERQGKMYFIHWPKCKYNSARIFAAGLGVAFFVSVLWSE